MKKKFMQFAGFLTCLIVVPFALYGQQKESRTAALPLDPAVRTGKLANGFTYYIRHNAEPKNRVMMFLVNKVGSILEDDDQQGLAHFMEHMNFNGTTHFPHNELVDYLQKAGVRFGADINAYTAFDETVYELPIPSDKPELLKGGMEIMRDWADQAVLDPVEIDKERGVVLEEKRLGKGAGERMQRQFLPVLLENSRYAVRQPIGLDTVLDNFKRPVIARFYHDWYRPDLQALIIVGDINADSLEKVVRSAFSDLKNPVKERPRPAYSVPLSDKDHFIAVTDKEMTATEAEVIFKHPKLVVRTENDYKAYLQRELFNIMMAERFAELSRLPDPPFVYGEARIGGFTGNLDSYATSMEAKPGELERGFKAIWRETERLKRFGFTATELDGAKAEYLSRVEGQYKEKGKISSDELVAEYQNNFLRGAAAPGIEREYQLAKQDLPGITLAQVNGLISDFTGNHNRDILLLAPDKDKAGLPGEAKINQWMAAVGNEPLQPYKDEVSKLPLLAKSTAAGSIVAATKDASLNVTTWTLSNGAKVVIKPTDFKNDEILFAAFAPGGTSLAVDADYQSAATAAGIVQSSGIGNYTATQLDKFLLGKQVYANPFINERFEGLTGSTTVTDLETMLQMADAYMTAPRKDTAVFHSLIDREKAELANRENDPGSVFGDTVSAVLGNYNVRKTGPSLAKLNQVSLDKALDFYRQRFADASGFTFIFVGNIDTLAFKPLVNKYLAGLTAAHRPEKAAELGIHIPYGIIRKTVYKGTEPKATVILVYSGQFDYTQAERVKMDALRETLEIRLLERLREDESGVYSPGVFVNTSKLPDGRFSFGIQFGCAPQNVDKLIASANDEVAKLKASGPLQENLDKWRAEDKTAHEAQLKTNNYWLAYLNTRLQNGDDLNQVSLYDGIRDGVTVKDVQAVAQKYLSGQNYIRLVLLPENLNASKP